MKTIFNKVRDEFPGYISHFRDAGIVDDRDFSEIIYETLSELFPLKTQILLRAKLWKLIQTELKKVMHELNISDADFHENITSDTSLIDVVLSKEDIYQNNNQTCSQSVYAEMRTNDVTSKRLIKDVDDDNNNDIDMNNNAILDKYKV
ncbi:uncharacterized protein LOC136095755 [Hydra vulgaris]|uniref:uncharacterized protein LOC136095755 n=1 Tax=Hydra vulgaris TaxID=6087 RepID=UPI0032E9DE7C